MKPVLYFCIAVSALFILNDNPVFAQDADEAEALRFTGDLRLRFESDYNVTGKARRDRARYRFRLNAIYTRGDDLQVRGRMVTGDPTNQQSPHVNFGDDLSRKSFSLDLMYLTYTRGGAQIRTGKHGFPIWKQNEMFWSDDVNPEGISALYNFDRFTGEKNRVRVMGGQYIIDDFDALFGSSFTTIQANTRHQAGTAVLSTALGYFFFNNADEDTVINTYNPLNGMDHHILLFSGQVRINARWPIVIGGDVMRNFKKPTIAGFQDETSGYVGQLLVGRLNNPGDWLFGVYYAYIEKFALIAHFAQDNWWRFGSGHTDSSDITGFELRLGYQMAPGINIIARHYVTEEIKGTREANRFRVDFNVGF